MGKMNVWSAAGAARKRREGPINILYLQNWKAGIKVTDTLAERLVRSPVFPHDLRREMKSVVEDEGAEEEFWFARSQHSTHLAAAVGCYWRSCWSGVWTDFNSQLIFHLFSWLIRWFWVSIYIICPVLPTIQRYSALSSGACHLY